jgi:hypothetical protein
MRMAAVRRKMGQKEKMLRSQKRMVYLKVKKIQKKRMSEMEY